MRIISKNIDFFFIKFPIVFPVIYFFLLNTLPEYEIYLIAITILLLAEPHFGATWLLYFNKTNKNHLLENKYYLIYFPIFIVFFTFSGFFLFKEITLLIFYAANIFHVTRQSVGISNFYKLNMLDINLQKNIIYFFNFLFFVIGYLRFYVPVITEVFILNCIILLLILICSLFYFYRLKSIGNFFTMLSGIIIFYPICFVSNPIHAILMGVTIHYSQYLIFSYKVKKGRDNEAKKTSNYSFFTSLIFYSIIMTIFTLLNKTDDILFSNLIIVPICAQMLHFYIDSHLWRFSIKHNRDNVLKHLIS